MVGPSDPADDPESAGERSVDSARHTVVGPVVGAKYRAGLARKQNVLLKIKSVLKTHNMYF